MKNFWKTYPLRLILATLVTLISSIVRVRGFINYSSTQVIYWAFITFFAFLFAWEAFFRIHNYLNGKYSFAQHFTKRFLIQAFLNWLVLISMRWSGIYFSIDHIPVKFNKLNYIMLVSIDVVAALGLTLAFAASFFFSRWKEGLLRNERLLKEKAQMQIHNLRNRVNPHFLFNSLSALDGLIKTEPDLASKFLQHLSKVYRYSLQSEDKESVTLETELQVFKHFVSLLEIRYGQSLLLQLELPNEATEKGIVPLTLELLTENALKHNEISQEYPLRIRIYTENEFLIVENTLRRKKTMETSNGKGLLQLQSLYAFLCKQPFLVEEKNELFRVSLPLL